MRKKYYVTAEIKEDFLKIYDRESPQPWAYFSRKYFPGVPPRYTDKAKKYLFRLVSVSSESDIHPDKIKEYEASFVTNDPIKSLKDLIKKMKIDETEWIIKDQNCSAWTVPMKVGNSETPIQTQQYRVSARLIPNNEVQKVKQTIASLIEFSKKDLPDRYIQYPEKEESKKLLAFCAFDLHMGKLSWKEECGEEYNLKIAWNLFMQGVNQAYEEAKHYKVDRILLPLGNDLLHIDGKNNMTFAGTSQDVDTRFSNIYLETRKMCVMAIDALAEIAPVDVLIVPGNHDATTMFTLGDCLDLYYEKHSSVTVDNSPKLRKYYQYGKNLLMFTHGNEETSSIRLGELCATEASKMWGDTEHRMALVGHLHHKSVKETVGFITTVVSSLSAPDYWHVSKGYIGATRRSEIFLWDKEKGLIGQRYSVV